MRFLLIAMLCVCAVLTAGGLLAEAPGSAQPELSAAGPGSGGEVRLEIRSLGVGGSARAGEWAGVQIEIEDLGSSQREVVLEVATTDIDGDEPRYRRTITTNPGSGPERAWVYAFLQIDAADRPLVVSAYAAEPLEPAAAERLGVRFEPGRLLGRTAVQGGAISSAEIAAMPVIGRAPAGLSGYERRVRASDPWLEGGHEVTTIAAGIQPADLPDRVAGLMPFETVVWTDAEPSRLTPARAAALRRGVEMGGHLVVCLTATPQIWLDDGRNPLAALLPDVEFERVALEGERDARSVLPLLTYQRNATLPDGLGAHVLRARATAGPEDAIALLRDDQRRPWVVRRRVELGMVTLVGLDVTSRLMIDRGLPGTRAFWHRVLGRTGLPAGETPEAAGQVRVMATSPRFFDSDLAGLIAKSQAVLLGVVAGLGVFGVYWLLAGPLCFLLLKRVGQERLSWLAFVAAAVVFTLVSWGLVSAVKPSRPDATVIGFLDVVDGSDRASVRLFGSVLVPSYGQGRVTVGSGEASETALVAPWTDSGGLTVGGAAFPDVRPYPVSGRGASSIEFPTRSTVKTIRADWFGERVWGSPRALDADGLAGRLRVDAQGRIFGRLAHGLPGPLVDGILVINPGQARLARQVGRGDIADIEVWSLKPAFQRWEPGQVIDLGGLTTPPENERPQDRAARRQYFEDLVGKGAGGFQALEGPAGGDTIVDRLYAAAFMSRLPPPPPGDRSTERGVGLRRHTHGLDLGHWFSQPCVMILGIVELDEDSPPPVELRLDTGGEPQPLPTSGRIVVRWVYPLPAAPPDTRPIGSEQGTFSPEGFGPGTDGSR
ncbi:MAG: hypothetical protein AAGF47_10070 [Planctomycetota bacterium]